MLQFFAVCVVVRCSVLQRDSLCELVRVASWGVWYGVATVSRID